MFNDGIEISRWKWKWKIKRSQLWDIPKNMFVNKKKL